MSKIFHIIIYVFATIGLVFLVVYCAIQFGWTKTTGIIDNQHNFFKNQIVKPNKNTEWSQSEEWNVLKEAIKKDGETIISAGEKTGINPRLIVAVLIVEQLRLFHSNREIFKQVFAPLQILGSQNQFSWGVMGIKQDTARQIENNLKDSQSVWYLGLKYEHLLNYTNLTRDSDIDSERFSRLTDKEDRYFSYLYSAILLKELEIQWSKAGFPISNRPEILATLFNIGFINSHPNPEPKSGGAEIEINERIYSFGGLAESFYYSNELITEFPR